MNDPSPLSDKEKLVVDAWNRLLSGPKEEGSFFDLGGDSASAVEFVTAVEAATGASMPFSYLVSSDGLRAILAWVRS